MLFADTGWTLVDANPAACRLLKRMREELLAAGRDEFFDASDPWLKVAREVECTGGSFEGELCLLREDGTYLPVKISIASRDGGVGFIFRGSANAGQAHKPEEFVGTFFPGVIHPDGIEQAARVCTESGNTPWIRKPPDAYRYRRKDGSWRYLEGGQQPYERSRRARLHG